MNHDHFTNMNFLVFTGPSNVGKTTSVRNVCLFLRGRGFNEVQGAQSNQSDNEGYGVPTNTAGDFYVLLKGHEDQLVLCYSWGDTPENIQWLDRYIRELITRGLVPDFVVMANRDGSEWLHGHTRDLLRLTEENCVEFPMGRMVRGVRRQAAVNWYVPTVARIVEEFILPRFLRF